MQFALPIYPITMLLVLFRFAALVGMTSVFGRGLVPVRVRLGIAVALTWFAAMRLPPEWMAHCAGINTLPSLVIALIGEVMLGAAIGLVCNLFFAILNMAGHVLGREGSLMMARVVDPGSGIQDVIISTLFSIVFTTLVLLWNGHLYMIKLIVDSFRILPPGFFWFKKELLEMYTTVGGDVFHWGLRFALPAMAGGLVIAVSMGLMAKMAPEFNVLFLSLPFRLSMGLGVICIFFLNAHDPLYKIFETMLMHVKYVLQGGV